jgi:hypothetical protein
MLFAAPRRTFVEGWLRRGRLLAIRSRSLTARFAVIGWPLRSPGWLCCRRTPGAGKTLVGADRESGTQRIVAL